MIGRNSRHHQIVGFQQSASWRHPCRQNTADDRDMFRVSILAGRVSSRDRAEFVADFRFQVKLIIRLDEEYDHRQTLRAPNKAHV
jgi:hypothetical protein